MNAFEKTVSVAQLRSTWREKAAKLKRSCFGIDRVSAQAFERNLERNLRQLHSDLVDRSRPYESKGLLGIAKLKPNSVKYRIICVPTVADRIVQTSLLTTLKPKLQSMGIKNPVSFGIVEGADHGLEAARTFACKERGSHPWVYKTDIQQFFDNIDRETLKASLAHVVRQPSLLPLLFNYIDTEITDGFDRSWQSLARQNGIRNGVGVRQGMPLSPLFAGCYLRDFDRQLMRWKVPAARYVDDIVAFFDTEKQARAFHSKISNALAKLGLTVGAPDAQGSKTMIASPSQPVEFLGMEIARSVSGYRLKVSQDCISDCARRMREAGDIAYLQEKNVSLTTMGRYFESVQLGLINAYSTAHNRDDLRDAISRASAGAQVKILKGLFGSKQFSSLTKVQQNFVGIDRLTLQEKAGPKPAAGEPSGS